jgi:hypothetical protein
VILTPQLNEVVERDIQKRSANNCGDGRLIGERFDAAVVDTAKSGDAAPAHHLLPAAADRPAAEAARAAKCRAVLPVLFQQHGLTGNPLLGRELINANR